MDKMQCKGAKVERCNVNEGTGGLEYGFYGTPLHVGESSIEYALRPYEAQK
jgi:hypothetical protein